MAIDRPPGVASRLMALLGDDGAFGRGIAAVVLVSAWVSTWRPQIDPDFGWHLRIGDTILATRAVPRTDVFSWLTGGQPFLAHSWAWDVVLAAAYRSGGLVGTSLVALPVSALAITFMWRLLKLVAPGIPPFPRSLLVAFGIVLGLSVWSPRAQSWDVVLVLATVLAWSLWLRRGSVRALVVIPLIPIVWVNVHGSGALAFVACLVALVVAIPVGIRWGTWPRRPILPIAVSSIVAIAAFAVGPNGPDILLLPFNTRVAGLGTAFLPAIAEWQSPDFYDPGFIALRVVLAGAALLALGLRRPRRDPLFLLLAAGWTFLALGAARLTIIAGPLLVIALAPGLAASARIWFGMRLQRTEPARQATTSPALTRLAVGTAYAVAVVIGLAGLIQIVPARQDAAVAARFPVATVAWLTDRNCHGRLLNAYDWGGYLSAAWTEEVATYGSSPSDLVDTEVALEEVRTDVRGWLDANRVDLVLMPTGGPLDRWLDEADGWSVAHRDPQATVHLRQASTACPAVVAEGVSDGQIR
ncbi:MAG: hypothetical protein ACJ779_09260 [Chloroflexota bacterium]